MPAASWAGGTPAPPGLPKGGTPERPRVGQASCLPHPWQAGRLPHQDSRKEGRRSVQDKASPRRSEGTRNSELVPPLRRRDALSWTVPRPSSSSPRLWGRHLACRILGRRDACPTRIPERGDAGASKTAHHTAERCDEKAHGIPTRERGGREKERAPPLAAANGKRAKQQMAIGVLGRERHEKRYRCSGPQGRACAGPRSAGAWER